MSHVDGRTITRALEHRTDIVVVGSGPAGAAVARTVARAGARVAVVEAGPWITPDEFSPDGLGAMARYYRNLGSSLILGNLPMPYLQGRMVGGTSVINGAISWRLPRDVYDAWVAADPPLTDALPWEDVERITAEIEHDLHIHPTDPAIAGPNNLLLARGAEALGIEHRPIARNVRGCRGLGRCLQGCPEGNKLSMERSYLPDAMAYGANIYSSCEVEEIVCERGRATGVRARTAGGGRLTVHAGRAVVLAASTIQTPILLLRNGFRHGPVGQGFQCHPGASVAGYFAEPVRMWTGATQGHEAIGLRAEGLKFEALGYDMPIVAMRLKGVGRHLARDIAELAHWANWGVAIKASSQGCVRPGWWGPAVTLRMNRDDLMRVRRGIRVLGEMMLAAGADYVTPGVYGWHERVTDRRVMMRLEDEGPLDPKAYTLAVTHMFGTARMGSRPAESVVGVDFQHHATPHLYVADSSIFPTNTGVNPQTSILALAALCARRLAA